MEPATEFALQRIAARLPMQFPLAISVLQDLCQKPVTSARIAKLTPEQIRESNTDVLLAHSWLSNAVSYKHQCLLFLRNNSMLIVVPRDQRGTAQLMESIAAPTERDSPHFYKRLHKDFLEAMIVLSMHASTAWSRRTLVLMSMSSVPAETWEQIVELHSQPTLRNSLSIELRISTRLLYPGTLVISRITDSLDSYPAASIEQQVTLLY